MKLVKIKKVLQLALPATVDNLLQTLVGFVDALIVARISLIAVTAVGLVNSILNVYLAVFLALNIGTSSLIARSIGKKDRAEAAIYTKQAVVMTIGFALFFTVVTILFGERILLAMGATSQTLTAAKTYFWLVGGLCLFMGLMTTFGSMLRAAGDTKTPMKINGLMNLLNIVFNCIFVFGVWFIPALGIIGSALGTVLARIIGTFLLYRKVQQSETPLIWKQANSEKRSYQELLRLAIPATLERLMMRMGQVVYFSLIVTIGPLVFAAHSIAGSIESFTYMPGYGLATAVATLVGISLGEGNLKNVRAYTRTAVVIGVIVMGLGGILLFIFSPLLARMFTENQETIKMVVIALRIDAFIQPILAISLIVTGALQGIGDTKTPLYSTAIGMWILRVLGLVIMGYWFHLGIAGVWLAIGLDLMARAIYLSWRFGKRVNKIEET